MEEVRVAWVVWIGNYGEHHIDQLIVSPFVTPGVCACVCKGLGNERIWMTPKQAIDKSFAYTIYVKENL